MKVGSLNVVITRARLAELERLVKVGADLIAAERAIVFDNNKEPDGVVRDYEARRLLSKYDRWLKRARGQGTRA